MTYPEPIILAETTSTNTYLATLCQKEVCAELTTVYSSFQSAGRGQRGNSWESEAGKNLLFSFVVYPDFLEAHRQFYLSQVTALALHDVLSTYTEGISIKWPNDIYWKDRKICGMLIENDLSGVHLYCSVIGIGLNINQEIFRSDAPNPVSLAQITGKTYDREEVLARFLRIFFNYYFLLLQEKEEEIRAAYIAALYHGDGYYSYIDATGRFDACIHAIEPTGHLILRLPDGERRRYAFKEVATVVPR